MSYEFLVSDLGVEQHLESLNTVWFEILNTVTPYRLQKLKRKSEPWIDQDIRSLRQSCRKAERKWKKDKLQISFIILKECLWTYQSAAKKAKSLYFSNLIEEHHQTPRVLFSIINSVLHPTVQTFRNPTKALCENFLNYFETKIINLRVQIQDTRDDNLIAMSPLASWTTFNYISLESLKEIVLKLKTSSSPLYIMHPRYMKLLINIVGPGLVTLLNKSMQSGLIPDSLKRATVSPVLKKPTLDTSISQIFAPCLSFLLFLR